MKVIIVFCLIGAVFANPILYNVPLKQNGLDVNMTQSSSSSSSSESDTAEIQSSEENTSEQSSESESLQSNSDDKTSEEDKLLENMAIAETSDNSLGSEENVRKVFTNIVVDLSAEDNSTEVKESSDLSVSLQIMAVSSQTSTPAPSATRRNTILTLETGPSRDGSDSSDSTDTSDLVISSESTSSESNETNEVSDSSDSSKSTEDSNASDSGEVEEKKAKDCLQGANSDDCESEEVLVQEDIGDDGGNYSVDHMMAPDEHHELNLRR